MPARSPPPTPVSSPRASPTPPNSPKQLDGDRHDDASSSEMGLNSSSMPLRHIQHMDAVHPEDMDIDDDPSHSGGHFGADGQENISGGGLGVDNGQERNTGEWMVSIARRESMS